MPDDRERGLRQQILETVQVAIPGAALGAWGGPVVAYTTFIAFGLFPAHWENLVAGLIWGFLLVSRSNCLPAAAWAFSSACELATSTACAA